MILFRGSSIHQQSDVISYGFEKKTNKQTISISDSLSETREENSLSSFTLLIFHSMTPCFQVKAYRKHLSLFLYYLNRNREIFYLSKYTRVMMAHSAVSWAALNRVLMNLQICLCSGGYLSQSSGTVSLCNYNCTVPFISFHKYRLGKKFNFHVIYVIQSDITITPLELKPLTSRMTQHIIPT